MKKLFETTLVRLASWYTKLVPGARLSQPIRSSERALNYSRKEQGKVARLADRKIVCLDIGARGGPLNYLLPYADHIEFVLAEPEPAEAQRLRDRGYTVIDALLSREAGTEILNVTRSPGCSSLLEPGGPMLDYYTGGDAARFDVVERVSLPARPLGRPSKDG